MVMRCPRDHNKNSVLLAIPVYNEEKHLDAVLDAVGHYTPNVLVIDDGSTDQSKLILARRQDVCVISHHQNCGYGQSIMHGLHFALGCDFKWVITMDCDLQHEPRQIPDFLKAIEEDDADIISGSRYIQTADEEVSPPADRRQINKMITRSLKETLGLNLTDAFCGFKAYRLEAVSRLELTETGYAFPLEFWVQAACRKLRIREIPVQLIYNDPQRYFGGELDDPERRLKHYQEVFQRALDKVGWSAKVEQR